MPRMVALVRALIEYGPTSRREIYLNPRNIVSVVPAEGGGRCYIRLAGEGRDGPALEVMGEAEDVVAQIDAAMG
jgi:hypothetical protein